MRLHLLFLTVLAAVRVVAAAANLDLGSVAAHTPYDRYMRPVKEVLGSVGAAKSSMDRAAKLMREGRGFRYVHSTPYLPAFPEETAARRAGDCKDKALWLCDQLNDSTARFVIGKVKRNSAVSHAWVMWENEGRWWILDCTLSWRPFPVESVRQGDYVPLYSYGRNATYRHAGTSTSTAASATAKAPVAAKLARR